MKYADVILPLKLPWCPVYAVPESVESGDRVLVKLAGKEYLGVVWHTDVDPSVDKDKVKPVSDADTGMAAISAEELKFWEFIAEYYLCSIGEVYKSAYPGSRIKSEKKSLARKIRAEASTRKQLEASDSSHAGKNGDGTAVAAKAESSRNYGKAQVLISSERTEFYLSAIRDTLTEGRQVLVLAPEKAFLGRIRKALSSVEILEYSSDATPVARRILSERVRTEKLIVLGTRSALFLPFRNLGLIIVDEEQDTFYKQAEPNPHYHGRDAALALASIHGSRVILGTESPSLETLGNCISGKYSMIRGTTRVKSVTIDVNAEKKKNGMTGPVSRKLIRAILETPGASVIVRGWEKEEELDFGSLCPGKSVTVMTMQELKREGASGATLIGVLQADAFVGKDDFRADERALQLVAQLSSLAQDVVIQTSAPERFTGERSSEALLAERKAFRYPPYTRLVDITVEDASEKRLSFICDKISGQLKTTGIPAAEGVMKFRLFLERDRFLTERKKEIAGIIGEIQKTYNYHGTITLDVDPQ